MLQEKERTWEPLLDDRAAQPLLQFLSGKVAGKPEVEHRCGDFHQVEVSARARGATTRGWNGRKSGQSACGRGFRYARLCTSPVLEPVEAAE